MSSRRKHFGFNLRFNEVKKMNRILWCLEMGREKKIDVRRTRAEVVRKTEGWRKKISAREELINSSKFSFHLGVYNERSGMNWLKVRIQGDSDSELTSMIWRRKLAIVDNILSFKIGMYLYLHTHTRICTRTKWKVERLENAKMLLFFGLDFSTIDVRKSLEVISAIHRWIFGVIRKAVTLKSSPLELKLAPPSC